MLFLTLQQLLQQEHNAHKETLQPLQVSLHRGCRFLSCVHTELMRSCSAHCTAHCTAYECAVLPVALCPLICTLYITEIVYFTFKPLPEPSNIHNMLWLAGIHMVQPHYLLSATATASALTQHFTPRQVVHRSAGSWHNYELLQTVEGCRIFTFTTPMSVTTPMHSTLC
jgi:hypothetical protein